MSKMALIQCRELDARIGTHTHTHRVIVYICFPINSMTTCRPVSVLLFIYGSSPLLLPSLAAPDDCFDLFGGEQDFSAAYSKDGKIPE